MQALHTNILKIRGIYGLNEMSDNESFTSIIKDENLSFNFPYIFYEHARKQSGRKQSGRIQSENMCSYELTS